MSPLTIGEPSAIDRIRAVLADRPATEAELRTLRGEADGWTRVLEGRLHAGERRLSALTDDPTSSLAAIAGELREVEPIRRELSETRSLIEQLDARAREVRSEWLRRSAAR